MLFVDLLINCRSMRLFSHILLVVIAVVLLLSACGRTPFPCFTVSENEDSIPVNKEVFFNAVCSDKAQEYFWDFPNDSIAYDDFVSYTFRDTGTFTVRLMVGNGTKSKTLSKQLIVKQP